MNKVYDGGSFRDPSGRVYRVNNVLYREVNRCYAEQYEFLINSGLYNELIESGKLVSHEEVPLDTVTTNDTYKVIKPNPIPFISYPYEWCFSQLKEAALLTLSIQGIALRYGMTLKDASAYNVQYIGCNPIFIDTLSFDIYKEGKPWVAYRQFCQHFLAPLMLCAKKDMRLNRMSQIYIDGIPLDLASSILPLSSYLSPGTLAHIHLHSKSQQKHSQVFDKDKVKALRMGKKELLALIENLEAVVHKLSWSPGGTEWSDYYSEEMNNYSDETFSSKKEILSGYLDFVQPRSLWDLGSNNGFFSRIASDKGIWTVSIDNDPGAVELNFQTSKSLGCTNITPIIMDLTAPSPDIGWSLNERMSLINRGPVDMAMALALIHHIVIGNNVPVRYLAELLSSISNYQIIEFVPKEDEQVQRILTSREDIFGDYDIDHFRLVFQDYCNIMEEKRLSQSNRTLFLLRTKRVIYQGNE